MKRMLLLICSTLSFLPLLGMNQKQIIPITTASYPQADNQQFAAQQMPYLTTMDNATAQQQPNKTICKACCDCADSCCNSAHNCCNCCVDTYLKSIFAMIICVADIAFLPVACLVDPSKDLMIPLVMMDSAISRGPPARTV